MQGRKNYQEKLFLNFQLSSRIPEDNAYRIISEKIDFSFLYKLTAPCYGKEGQASIDPVVFFKLMLYGYLENIPSDRRIIQSSAMRLDILYFIGYDIDESLPWHSTLSRTRKLYGKEVFLELFRQILKQCIEKGMVSGARLSIDSMLVQANASMESLIEKDLEVFNEELESNDHDNKEVIKLKADQRHQGKGRNNKTHYSPTDPDARIATKPGKPYKLNYLGQLSVDTASHVITDIQAFPADKRDSQCLKPLLEETIENLKGGGLDVLEIIADANYSSTESLEAIESMNITGYIPNFGGYKPSREGFTYDSEHDRYVCSQGKYLLFKGVKKNHSESVQYLSSTKDCRICPIKAQCIGKSNQKMITKTLSRPLFEQMEKRMDSMNGRRMLSVRKSTVEPVIGSLVGFYNAKRVQTKGLSNANKCLILAGIAYNLKKLIRFKDPKLSIKQALFATNRIFGNSSEQSLYKLLVVG